MFQPWQQNVDPFHSVWLSAAVAAVPIIVLFALLITKKLPGHLAAATTLVAAYLVATGLFHMPIDLAGVAALYGALMGLFPIGWIVLSAVFLYNLSVRCGSFAIVCRSIESITGDRRLQALLIAYCFGAFLEGCAGFGAPVAITTGMLVGLGFQPLYAAGICLLANSTPVAYGSIGIPIVMAGSTSHIDPSLIGIAAAHTLPVLSFILPFWLIVLMSGFKGAREVWPAILVTALSYTITMLLVATYMGPALPNILSSIVSLVALTAFLRVWKPATIWRFPGEAEHEDNTGRSVGAVELLRGWTPFVLLILCIGNWGMPAIHGLLDMATRKFDVSPLSQVILPSGAHLAVQYKFDWLAAAGTSILIASTLSIILLRISAKQVGEVAASTLNQLRNPLVTFASIVGFAYLANYSGMTIALGSALKATGSLFPLVSPIVGWIGVFVSGSDTSSNALFCNMQKQAALNLNLNPLLTVAANTTGGVTAKMISTQSIAVACAASKLVGKEGQLFRMALPHSAALLAIVCVVTYLQAYALPGLVPAFMGDAAAPAKAGIAPLGPVGWTIVGLSLAAFAGLSWVNSTWRPAPEEPEPATV